MRWGLWLLLLAAPARATLIAEESFAYANGSNLAGQNGGSGWAGAWVTSASATAGSFTMAALAGEPSGVQASGLALAIKDNLSSVTRIFRPVDCSAGSPADNAGVVETVTSVFGSQPEIGKAGTTIWLSFIARGHAGSISAGSHLFEGVGSGTDVCNNTWTHDYTESDKFGENLFVGRGAGNANYGYERTCGHATACNAHSSATCSGNDYQSTIGYSTGVVHWVVLRVDFGANLATSDATAVTITMWVDPALPASDLAVATGTPLFQVGHGATTKAQWVESAFHFNTVELQSVTKGSEIDEYRIGTTFADVVGPGASTDLGGLADLASAPDLTSNVDLAGADFAGLDLSGVDLSVPIQDLSGVDFFGVDFAGVDFAVPSDLSAKKPAGSGCGCQLGARPPRIDFAALLLLLLLIRRLT